MTTSVYPNTAPRPLDYVQFIAKHSPVHRGPSLGSAGRCQVQPIGVPTWYAQPAELHLLVFVLSAAEAGSASGIRRTVATGLTHDGEYEPTLRH